MSQALEQFTDQTGPMGVVFERRTEGPRDPLGFERLAVIMARCASSLEIRFAGPGGVLPADSYNIVLIPPGLEFSMVSRSAVGEWTILLPSPALMGIASDLYDIPATEALSKLAAPESIARSNWMNEVMHRYVFERCVAGGKDNHATAFLEAELVKDVYYRRIQREDAYLHLFDLDGKRLDHRGPVLRRAMAFVEANLFSDLSVQDIVEATGISESTLLRQFKSHFGVGPQGYIQARRLDESRVLLRSGHFTVAEVADTVGYSTVSAFSAAFRKRFGKTPKSMGTE